MKNLTRGIYDENEVTDRQIEAAEAAGRPVMVDMVARKVAVGDVGERPETLGVWYNHVRWEAGY